MSPVQEECDRKLEEWLDTFRDAGVQLAALAVVRRGECNLDEACRHLYQYTAGIMCMDPPRLAGILDSLGKQGYIARHGDRYAITSPGKEYMFRLLKQWNRYVDAMNNLWGCYYGT